MPKSHLEFQLTFQIKNQIRALWIHLMQQQLDQMELNSFPYLNSYKLKVTFFLFFIQVKFIYPQLPMIMLNFFKSFTKQFLTKETIPIHQRANSLLMNNKSIINL